MLSCTRKIEFDAAHRVIGHGGKCRYLHGHRYVIEATFVAQNLSDIDLIIDFSLIKDRLGGWIDQNWDHNAILSIKDVAIGDLISAHTNQKIYYLNQNPTAEIMALYLLHEICPRIFHEVGLQCVKIRLYETPNCYAEASI